MKKKKNAIMIADTRPALIGHVLLQLKETNANLFDEALIYYDKIGEVDKTILNSIIPCKFIKYNHPFRDAILKLPDFKRFSVMMFPRYDMFTYLDEYETVTWIDTDVLIKGDLSPAIEKAKATGMAANFEDEDNCSFYITDYVRTSFKVPIDKYDMSRYNMSSGFIVVADTLPLREEYTKWCYDKTVELANNLVLPDQGILNIMIQEFNINVASVGMNGGYCFYPEYKRDSSDAIIVHSWGARKFWNNWYLYNEYPKWKEIYNKWLKMGGSKLNLDFKPGVSVVIPCYKPDIEKMKIALDSILINQKDKNGNCFDNCEVIIVIEPVETKPTEDLVKSYNDPRINLIINKEKYGIAKSINIGIKAAKSDYIMRMDDDDISGDTRLYKQIEYLNKNKDIVLVTSDFEYFEDMNERRYSFEGDMSKAWSIFTCPFDHPTIMFRKSFFTKNKLYYDEKRGYVEDWELWLRAFDKGMKVGCIHEVLFYHRWHNGSAGQTNKTVDMMRELVQKNFMKLGVNIKTEDLPLIGPWNGMTSEEDYKKLVKIFDKALTMNLTKKFYDQKSLEKAFRIRLLEAKTGNLSGVVFPINKALSEAVPVETVQLKHRNIVKRTIIKLFGPIYKVYKNKISMIVRDNVLPLETKILNVYRRIDELSNENKKMIDSLNSKISELEKDPKGSNIKINNQLNLIESNLKNIVNDNSNLIKDKIYDLNHQFNVLDDFIWTNVKNEKKIFLISTPEHSNIGDSAICLGEQAFIKKYYSNYRVIEVSLYDFENRFKMICNLINDDDLILMQGGGNLGNRYIHEEKARRIIINSFPENKIIILPQTIYFDTSEEGKEELEISKRIYNKHKDLTIFTRGEISMKLATEYFPNAKVIMMIDSALMLQKDYDYERNGILLCIRDINDEGGLTKENQKAIREKVKKIDAGYDTCTNLHNDNIYKKNRGIIVGNELQNYAKHKVVITDRLHGLVFSIITKTPCIVFGTYNHKIKEFYEQMKESNAIFFVEKNVEIDDIIEKAFLITNPTYPNMEILFDKMYNEIDWK